MDRWDMPAEAERERDAPAGRLAHKKRQQSKALLSNPFLRGNQHQQADAINAAAAAAAAESTDVLHVHESPNSSTEKAQETGLKGLWGKKIARVCDEHKATQPRLLLRGDADAPPSTSLVRDDNAPAPELLTGKLQNSGFARAIRRKTAVKKGKSRRSEATAEAFLQQRATSRELEGIETRGRDREARVREAWSLATSRPAQGSHGVVTLLDARSGEPIQEVPVDPYAGIEKSLEAPPLRSGWPLQCTRLQAHMPPLQAAALRQGSGWGHKMLQRAIDARDVKVEAEGLRMGWGKAVIALKKHEARDAVIDYYHIWTYNS